MAISKQTDFQSNTKFSYSGSMKNLVFEMGKKLRHCWKKDLLKQFTLTAISVSLSLCFILFTVP